MLYLFESILPNVSVEPPGGASRRDRATGRPTVSAGQGRAGAKHLVLPAHRGSVLPRTAVVGPAAGDGAVHQPFLQVLPL